MSIKQLMETALPINRKERFYTGTIFPMIVCRDNFNHLRQFLSLINDYQPQPIDATPSTTNIQFFTEYGIKESIYGKNISRFPNPPLSKDTPDIIILIQGKQTSMIAIEAKMFLRPSPTSLQTQMERQHEILKSLQEPLGIDNLHLVALVPQQWNNKLSAFNFPVITWNTLYDQYSASYPDDYFLEVLKYALDNYDDLVSSTQSSYSQKTHMTGLNIYRQYKNESLEIIIMGRNGGLTGKSLKDDLMTNSWSNQPYEVSSEETPRNRNWFYVEDFISLIDAIDD